MRRASFTFRAAATLSPEARVGLEHKLATALEAAGHRALTTPLDFPTARACIVRLYYRSMGDELLACDSEPMTSAEAKRMRDSLGRSHAPNVVPDTDADIFPVGAVRSLRRGARLVVFPSQIRSEVDEQESAVAA